VLVVKAKINLPYKRFLGYEKGEDGLPKVVESEAKIVRQIYELFYYKGKTATYIASYLTKNKIPTPANKEVWQASTIESILTNEKYKGDALLQKTFTVDFLTKKTKVNEGEVQQYYIEGSHTAIISPEFFDLVQIEIAKRKGQKRSTSGIFASKLICGDCGNFYGSKVWHSNSIYKRTIWQCNHKFSNKKKCSTPHFTEEQLKEAFVNMFNATIENKDEIIETLNDIILELTDTTKLDGKISELNEKLSLAAEQIKLLVKENSRTTLNQAEYEERYHKQSAEYFTIANTITELEKEKTLLKNKLKEVQVVLDTIRTHDSPIDEFDENLFFALIENITVNSKTELVFCFKDGSEVQWDI